jgi:hypothetical protein
MNINVRWPTQHEWAVLGTHAIAAAGTGLAVAAFAGVLDQAQVQEATGYVKRIASDVSDFVGAVSGLIAIGTAGFAVLRSGPLGSLIRAASTIAGSPKFTAQLNAAPLEQKAPVVAITDNLPEVRSVPVTNDDAGKVLAGLVQSSTVQVAKI